MNEQGDGQFCGRRGGMAKERLIDLLDNEVLARYPVTETPWIMMRLNLWRVLSVIRVWIARLQPFSSRFAG